MSIRPVIGGARLTVSLMGLAAMLYASPLPAACGGDCDANGRVSVDELVTAVDVSLSQSSPEMCSSADANGNAIISVDELVTAARNALHGCARVVAYTPTPTVTPTITPTATADPQAPIPTSADELVAWLRARSYATWPAESARHRSAGPHFTNVRTFINQIAFASLTAGNATHPAGTALVKELYGTSADVQGWSVMVKLDDDSDGGENWYWYERFRDTTFAAATGAPGCTGCHSLGHDFIRSPFPLQ